MKTVGKIVRNFLVANLLFFIPAIWVVAWYVPERLEIKVRAPNGLTAKIGFMPSNGQKPNFSRVVSVAGASGVQTLKSYFADPIDKRSLAVSFLNRGNPYELISISILKHCFIRETLSKEGFDKSFECKDGVYVCRQDVKDNAWRLTTGSDWRLVCAVFFVEFMVLLACCLALKIETDIPKKTRLQNSALVASLTTLFFCVAVPLQSYLVNKSMFDFTMGEFVGEVACLFAGTFVFLFVALYVSVRCFGMVMHLLLIALVAYEYLETGILSIGMPQLNGEIWFFCNGRRQLIDTIILMVILGVPLVCYHWLKNHLHWGTLILMILCLASLFDIRSEKQDDAQEAFSEFFAPKLTIAKRAVYSPIRNIFVFILDSTTVEAAAEVMKTDAELRSKFSGMTAFCNNLGMGPYTDSGLPGLMTGRYVGEGEKGGASPRAIFSENSFIAPYLQAKAYVGFINGLYEYGICSMVQATNETTTVEKRAESIFSIRTKDLLGMNLREIVRFRLAPFKFKSWYLAMVFLGMDNHAKVDSESTLYPILSEAPVEPSCRMSLHVYHTNGSHPPVSMDEAGNLIPRGSRENYEGFCGQTHFVLRQLGQLLDTFRSRGIYDNSLILICADHGSVFAKPGRATNLTPRAFPMLWVKPENATSLYWESRAATSHSKIAELMRAAVLKHLTIDDIENILRCDDRFYRENNKDWFVDKDGNVK